jgi:nucleotide-binding universal stress UspA family protein
LLKGILLALDDTPASMEARKLAIHLAQKHRAVIQGIAVVDPAIVAPVEPVPIGGEAVKEHKDAVLLEKARVAAVEFAQRFTYDCHEAQIHGEASVVQGAAKASLIAACAAYDIIMLGIDTSFSEASGGLSPLVGNLLRENPRPLIVTPKESPKGARTFVAYDGSIPAMRALQLFCCLQMRQDAEVIVATVDHDAAKATALADVGAGFMRDHGYNATTHAVSGDGDVTTALIDAAKAADAGMIVAGAYGHRGFREWLLGATTERLMTSSPIPLFIHH